MGVKHLDTYTDKYQPTKQFCRNPYTTANLHTDIFTQHGEKERTGSYDYRRP